MRLNPNQIASRCKGLLATLGDVPDDQLVEILEKIGWLDRLRGKGAIAEVSLAAPKVGSVKGFESLEAAREDILQGLYERAKGGDAQSARAFADISSENAPTDRFNINVNITPYTIADPSLKSIMLQAEQPVVDNALEGLELRMEIDEAAHSLRDLGKRFRTEFAEWAEIAYAPKDV